jgi:hypothetical protein
LHACPRISAAESSTLIRMAKSVRHHRLLWQLAIASKLGPKKAACRHVLLTLALDMSEAGDRAWPSQARLAQRTSLNERVVRRLLALADLTGWVLRAPRNRERGKNWKCTSYVARIPESFPRDELARLKKRLNYPEDRKPAPSDMDRTDSVPGEDNTDGMVRTPEPPTSPNHFSNGISNGTSAPKRSKSETEGRIRSAAAKHHERATFELDHPEVIALLRQRGGWNYLGHAREIDQLGYRINELLNLCGYT